MKENKDDKHINMDNFNPDEHMKTESPLIFHVYNDKREKAFKIICLSSIEFIIYLL